MESSRDEKVSGLIWHYTSLDALIQITTSHRLWASSAAFMNDANEMTTHQEALRRTYARIKSKLSEEQVKLMEPRYGPDAPLRSIHESYLISASKKGDHLTLWRNYGAREGAFAIGLDASVLLKPVLIDKALENEGHPNPPEDYYEDAIVVDEHGIEHFSFNPDIPSARGGRWWRVEYVPRDGSPSHEALVQREAARLEDQVKNPEKYQYDVDFSYVDPDNISSLEKDEAFEDEAEVRIVVAADPAWKFVRYRSGPFGLTPYVELAAHVGAKWYGDKPSSGESQLPIREIRIGPTALDLERQKYSLRALLDANGYKDVKIRVSEIPFR